MQLTSAPVVGSITRVDSTQAKWESPISRPEQTSLVGGSFRSALQEASDLARANTSWIGSRFNDAPTIGIFQAGQGVYALGKVGASIHTFNPIDSPKYVSASATRTEGSDLLALVSRDNWVDLRTTDAATAQRLLRIPGVGTVINF